MSIKTVTITVEYHQEYDQRIREAIDILSETPGSIARWGLSKPVNWVGRLELSESTSN